MKNDNKKGMETEKPKHSTEEWETPGNEFEVVIEMDQLLKKQKRNILWNLMHFINYFELQMQTADLREQS